MKTVFHIYFDVDLHEHAKLMLKMFSASIQWATSPRVACSCNISKVCNTYYVCQEVVCECTISSSRITLRADQGHQPLRDNMWSFIKV